MQTRERQKEELTMGKRAIQNERDIQRGHINADKDTERKRERDKADEKCVYRRDKDRGTEKRI